jgi:DNA polymerase
MRLSLDFETRSLLDIKKVGLDQYARHADAILLAWAIDDGPVHVEENLRRVGLPHLERYLINPIVKKCAWNKDFEQAILEHALGYRIPDQEWEDTAVLARFVSLPGHLASCGEALGLSPLESKQKAAGTRLINKFSKPRPDGTFRDRSSDPEDWARFVEYCRQDVVAERNIATRLKKFTLPEQERKLYLLDQKINRRGLPVSVDFAEASKSRAAIERDKIMAELKTLTGLANPNSPKQLLSWLRSEGYPYLSLGAAKVRRALTLTSDVESDTIRTLEKQ